MNPADMHVTSWYFGRSTNGTPNGTWTFERIVALTSLLHSLTTTWHQITLKMAVHHIAV